MCNSLKCWFKHPLPYLIFLAKPTKMSNEENLQLIKKSTNSFLIHYEPVEFPRALP